jgi:hypothetical protein
MGELGKDWLRGVGCHGARDGGWGGQPSLAVMLATGQFKHLYVCICVLLFPVPW